MPGPKLTVTIIALNEEANIRDCLESVRWADEVIVSDSGSADRTAELCRNYGAKVFMDDWLGYGRQKNLCQDRAANEWILNIDADERITPELREEIQNALAGNGADGYLIPRKNYFGGFWVRRCGWYPDYNLRLYRKSAGRFVERRVHEAVHLEGRKERLKSPMIHLTYRDTTDYLSRMQRYSTLAAEDMLNEGRRPSLLDLFVRPQFTFFKMFVLKRGFLDGTTGLVLSMLYAFYTFSKYAKLWELTKGRAI
mgnify:CR=1 FL=1